MTRNLHLWTLFRETRKKDNAEKRRGKTNPRKVGSKWGSKTGSYGLGRYLDQGKSGSVESDLILPIEFLKRSNRMLEE